MVSRWGVNGFQAGYPSKPGIEMGKDMPDNASKTRYGDGNLD